MDCRTCEKNDRATGVCREWGIPITQVMADGNYHNIIAQCYSSLFKGPAAPTPTPPPGPPGPAPAPVAFTPPPPRPIWEQPLPPAAPAPRGPDLRSPNMFESMNGSPEKPKKKTRLSGKKAAVELILNAVVWVTIVAIVVLFFIVAVYSQINPQIVIRQGDIPQVVLVFLGLGTLLSLVKGVSVLRGSWNAS